jgi:hypothetical protein
MVLALTYFLLIVSFYLTDSPADIFSFILSVPRAGRALITHFYVYVYVICLQGGSVIKTQWTL